MKSIIAVMTNVHQISGRSNNGRIPRLPNMEWGRKILRWIYKTRLKILVRIWFDKLFSPIKDQCTHKIKKCGQNKYIARNSCPYNYAKNIKGKKVTPEKSGYLLDAFHRAWSINHNHSSNLHPQNTIKFIKNIIINVPKLPGFLLKAIFLERLNLLKENIR